ncbi:MAG: phosphatidylglycerol lysyltransferase domain-containing protein [Lentimicrobiaceae bacterium]|nr:phosphatidylglycerol lysyltransferase domain-containing protein [Lentimicrobiaceae bacterium]
MLQFQPLDIKDQPLISSFSQKFDCQLLNYSFAVLFLYRNVCHFQYALSDHFLLIKATHNQEDYFMFPMGEGNLPAILDKIALETLDAGKSVRFYQFCNDTAPLLLQWAEEFCQKTGNQRRTAPVREDYEYIYSSKKLSLLEGHLFKPKRNQINSFTKNNVWSWMPITKENMAQVKYFNALWDANRDSDEYSSLSKENVAIEDAFTFFFELRLQGILLQIEDKIVAFSIGFPLNKETFLVLFEKADRTCKGAYTMINKLFASEISKKYEYINRAEDAGVEGLRKAKLSYLPEYLIEVNELEIF